MKTSKQLYCRVPFESVDIKPGGEVQVCCWTDDYTIGDLSKQNLMEAWNSPKAIAFRESIFDGSYRYCDSSRCAHLKNSKSTDKKVLIDIDRPEKELKKIMALGLLNALKNKEKIVPYYPLIMNLSYDQTCNLSCPSCRVSYINHNSRKEEFDKILEKLKPYPEHLVISSSGDPFYSAHFLDLFFYSTTEDLKSVDRITLTTNGVLLTQKLWEKVSPAFKSKEISIYLSIDAAKEETYKLNRRGGDWNKLMNNLEFIAHCPDFEELTLMFVVQENNFRQMKDFVKLAKRHKAKIVFRKLSNWGTFTPEDYLSRNVYAKSHPSHQEFLKVLEDPLFSESHIDIPPFDIDDTSAGPSILPGLGFTFASRAFHEKTIRESEEIHNYAFNGTTFETDFSKFKNGHFSRKIVATKAGFMGFGFFHDKPYDISSYSQMILTLMSPDPKIAHFFVLLKDANSEVHVDLIELGFVADGSFKEIRIPLNEFARRGVDLKNLICSFGIIREHVGQGDHFYLNDLYLI